MKKRYSAHGESRHSSNALVFHKIKSFLHEVEVLFIIVMIMSMVVLARIIVPSLIAFLVGIFFATTIFPSFAFAYLLFLLGFVFFLISAFVRPSFYFIGVAVLCIAFGLGVFRFTMWQSMPIDSLLESSVDRAVRVHGTIIDEPDVREAKTHLIVLLDSIETDHATTAVFGKALLIVPTYPQYAYGESIVVSGKISLPQIFAGDDGRVFNYPEYLHAKGVRYQFVFPKVETQDRQGGNALLRGLFFIKHAFTERLQSVLPEPQSALAEGLLLGGKESLGSEWIARFRDVGIVHIIVLSGYNMTIIAEWLATLFLFLGFYPSIFAASMGIVLFTLMTGAGATVVRAAIMALLVLLARLTGRTYDVSRALLFAGVIMVAIDPGILLYDPSFQLSFLAALGLLHVAPLVKPYAWRLKRFPIFEEVVVSTIATQALVLPLLIYQTGMLSLVSLFANIFVLPLIPLTMLFAFLGGLAGFVSSMISFVLILPAQAMLSWMLTVAKYGAMLPFAAVSLPPISGTVVIFTYVLVAFYLCMQHKKKDKETVSAPPHQVPLK